MKGCNGIDTCIYTKHRVFRVLGASKAYASNEAGGTLRMFPPTARTHHIQQAEDRCHPAVLHFSWDDDSCRRLTLLVEGGGELWKR